YRKTATAGDARRPSVNDLVLAGVVRALARHPSVNATLEDESISRWRSVHLGVAVAVDGGLIVPVIRNAQALSLVELRDKVGELANRARSRTLMRAEIEGATFTVTNLGSFGIDAFTPIINPPQVAILGVGRITDASM